MQRCVERCIQCKSIDPAPARHEAGDLAVEENWVRLSIDTTHYKGKCYLTMVDCGPSRFALWREVSSENSAELIYILEQVFRERGPPSQLLLDNSATFRSHRLTELCQRWNVQLRHRAAYRPSGNGVVERNHRTIKRTAARTGRSPLDAVFFYNLAAKKVGDILSSPSRSIFAYPWRHPRARPELQENRSETSIREGDKVLTKPVDRRCDSRWVPGRVTGIASGNNISVDGTPRHILDIRRLYSNEEDGNERDEVGIPVDSHPKSSADRGQDGNMDENNSEADDDHATLRRSARIRRPPVWHNDYEF